MTTAPTDATPTCPRCGYDLGGQVGSWTNQCPLALTCSECGFSAPSGEIIPGHHQRVRGFVEHGHTRPECLVWPWRTLGWLVVPGRFWRRVQLWHFRGLARAFGWLATIMLWLAVAACVAWTVEGFRLSSQALLRAGPGYAMSEWSFVSFYVRTAPLRAVGLNPGARRGLWSDLAHVLTSGLPPLVSAGLFAWAACVAIVLVAPVTRREAKIRGREVARAAVYGLAWMPLALVAAFVARHTHSMLPWDVRREIYENAFASHLVAALLAVLWQVLWWRATVTRGWHLQGARSVWCALTLAAALAGLLALAINRHVQHSVPDALIF